MGAKKIFGGLPVPRNASTFAKIMDWEKYGAHRLLAQGYIDLSLLKPREPVNMQVKLQPEGVLDLDITYEPYSALRLAGV